MKKLLLFSVLLIAASTTFATVQDDVAAVLAKTRYKNIMTFLGEVSIHPDYCANGIVYETEHPLSVFFNDGFSWVSDNYELERGYDDTVSLCKSVVETRVDYTYENEYYNQEYIRDDCNVFDEMNYGTTGDPEGAYQNFIYYNDSLYYFDSLTSTIEFPEGKKLELFFIQLSYFLDKKVHIRYRRMVVRNTNNAQEVKVKYELIDNDINGRVALTNLTVGDSVFFSTETDYKSKKFSKHLYFDKVPNYVYIRNYNKKCMTEKRLWPNDATEMPRIHDTVIETVTDTVIETVTDTVTVTDTIYITKTDTIYITKTDTVYIEKEPNKTAIIDKQTNLNVWPNPATAFVNAEAEESFSYTLLNNAGIILKKEEGESSYTISMSEYPDGIYYIKTSDGVIRKIVKK